MNAGDVLGFWFETLEPKQWWQKDKELDLTISERFGELHKKVSQGEYYEWRDTPEGSLAEIIVLDQFSRNIYRGSAEAFRYDGQALTLSQVAIDKGYDARLSQVERQFLYLPFMHSESKLIHQHAVRLFSQLGDDYGYDFELKHKAIIDRFGRYPHRNDALNRQSTAEELEFLQQPGSSF
ncbi:DUF924 family protein [Kangiella sediminilitoris]|uniref:Membrane protein n=1 Tax=Kangiella sediminilitoris TaxID=1144748 RepID=A0A1B3BAQ3_9GAMM|nr:DUF924 family protein [Kangiella sediminilitoris]AOE49870.1 Membrane protein [Kangiella sediminilitoris]